MEESFLEPKKCGIPEVYKGSFYVFLSAVIFSVMTLWVQSAGERGIPSFQMMGIRCLMQTFYSAYLCLWVSINPFGTRGSRSLPILRGIIAPLAAASLYYGATKIAISDATVLVMSSPIWTPFIAKIALNEPFKLVNIFSIIVGFIGVVFVAQPKFLFEYFLAQEDIQTVEDDNTNKAQPGSIDYTIAAVVCVIGAIFYSISFTIIRKSGSTVRYQVLVFYYALLGVVSSFTLMFIFQGPFVNPTDVTTWLYLLAIGAGGCVGQSTLNKGAQMIDASKTSVIRNADIGLVLLWQLMFLQEIPTLWSFVGLILITICTLATALSKSAPISGTQAQGISLESSEDIEMVTFESERNSE